MFAFALKCALIALAVVLVAGGLWRVMKRPNRSRQHRARMRMPVFVPLVGWVLLVVGFLMALIAFTSRYADLLPVRISSLVIVAGGVFFLVMYQNWYVESRLDELHFRTVFGRERVIKYADIVDYRMLELNGRPRVQVGSSSGVKLSFNPHIYPLEALFDAIRFRERAGRWPRVGERR